MSARILDGTSIAGEIRAQVREQTAAFAAAGRPIKLAAILVGSEHAGQLYARSQRRQCEQVGVEYELVELPPHTNPATLFDEIDRLNADPRVTGIMLHLPLPPGLDAAAAQYRLDPYKDVEGVNPANIGLLFYGEPILAPCTAIAVNELIARSGVAVRGAHAVVVGQSRIVGKPVTMFLLSQMATVTACHIATRELASHARVADILVVAIGRPRAIGPEYVKPGAVVIDVGINRVSERDATGQPIETTVGDVDFEAVRPIAGALTPVPGGVGPVTVAMLLRNTIEAARKQRDRCH